MRRAAALIITLTSMLWASGCSVLRPAPLDAACQGREDAELCRQALDLALTTIPDRGVGYSLTVAPVTCDARGCTTWVNAMPSGEECRPHWDVELMRPPGGRWAVGIFSHGDPACAFE